MEQADSLPRSHSHVDRQELDELEPVFPGLGKGASIIYNQDETRGLVRNVSML